MLELLTATLLLESLLLVKPDSLNLVEPYLSLKLTLLPHNCLREDEDGWLPMLFDVFHFEPLFILLDATYFHEAESLPAKLLEAIAVAYKT